MPARLLAAALLAALGACASAPPKKESTFTAEMLKPLTDAYREYVASLVALDSIAPLERAEAMKKLEGTPYAYFPDDRELIRRAAARDETARKELARRGKILDGMLVFWGKPDTPKWNDARRRIVALGQDARIVLINNLLRMLLNGQLREHWPAIRFQLVEIGEETLETAVALFDTLVEQTPDTIIYRKDDLVQVALVILSFGEKGRPVFEKYGKSPRFNVRRAVAVTIGEGHATENFDILERLLRKDPDWMVRADAADAMGSIRDRARAGAVLVEAIKAERDRNVKPHIAVSLGTLVYADGVTVLVASLEGAEYEYAEKAMFSLFQITGERHMSPPAWQKWYAKDYPRWKRERAK
ncbi:MAG TPA: HEAT repeat domain-containing protein [Planctomycetota bacterium]|nr:HEAT repeat domain-containing protein [Planctomycetota bacterium]